MKVTTAGEKDDEDAGDNPEHDELPPEKTLRPDEVFQKISFRPNMEEQKKLLLFQFQARHNQYVKDFLAQSWMKEDPFADACKLQNSTRHSLHDVFAELQSWNAVASSETRTIFWDYTFVLVSFKKRGWCRSFEKVALKRLGLRRGACISGHTCGHFGIVSIWFGARRRRQRAAFQ